MADLTITAANVGLAGAGARVVIKQVGESVTQGQPVYLKAADNKYWKTDADAEATAKAAGICMTAGAADEYVVLATSGPLDLGATLTVGQTYVCSTTAGGIAPLGDLASGDFLTILGAASAAGKLELNIYATNIALA